MVMSAFRHFLSVFESASGMRLGLERYRRKTSESASVLHLRFPRLRDSGDQGHFPRRSRTVTRLFFHRVELTVPLYSKGNLEPAELSGRHCLDGRSHLCCSGLDRTEFVRRELKDRNPATAKVLLIRQPLIGSDEQIKLCLGQREQFAVPYALPTHLLRAIAFMTDKQFAQR